MVGKPVRGRPRGWSRHGEHEVPQVLDRLIELGYGMLQPPRHRAVTVQAQREIQVKPGGEQTAGDRLS